MNSTYYTEKMKSLIYIFLFFMLVSTESVLGNDHEWMIREDHEALIGEYLEYERQFTGMVEIEVI